jgi:hypothetical protein
LDWTHGNTLDIIENKFPGMSTATYAIDFGLYDEVAYEGFAAVANGLDIGVLGTIPCSIRFDLGD